MIRRLKFLLVGLIPGTAIMIFILDKKGASCSGYFPNSRVIAETSSKKFNLTEEFSKVLTQNKITEEEFKEQIFSKGNINFKKSDARREPCPQYFMNSETSYGNFEIEFEKCDSLATFYRLKKK